MQGTLDRTTGEVNLEFAAEFKFSAFPFYSAPPLIVNTVLTTGTTAGKFKSASGMKLQGKAGGKAR